MYEFLLDLRKKYGQNLTQEQQIHIESIILRFSENAYEKYVKGQQEHGGDLWTKGNIATELYNEGLDIVIYSDTELNKK